MKRDASQLYSYFRENCADEFRDKARTRQRDARILKECASTGGRISKNLQGKSHVLIRGLLAEYC